MSGIIRYANPVIGERDRDGDHIVDGRNSNSAPIYELDLSKPTAVIGYFQLTLSMLRWLPLWFIGGWLFVQYVVIPIAVTAPVALFTSKPVILTHKEAGGDLQANTNNLTIGVRSFFASAAEGIQSNQIKSNSDKSDKKPSEGFMPRAKVVFAKN